MKRSLPAVIAGAIAVLALSGIARSQCPGNDGFSATPCCTPATPAMPSFPSVSLNGLGACLLNCSLESQFGTTATLTPVQVLCDYWIIFVTINAGTFSLNNQFLVAKYARTWLEFPSTPAAPTQVWRFLVNGDFQYPATSPAGAGCPVPLSALPPYSFPVHFIGSVDFALDCAAGSWQCAYNLTHFCPTDSHAVFSQRPIAAAAGWLKRTYHFVGPANFTFGLCMAPFGSVIAESSRTSIGLLSPVPYTCLAESEAGNGFLEIVDIDCACEDPGPVPSPTRYTHHFLFGSETCGGVPAPFNSVFLPIPTLPTGMRSLRIGSYSATTPITYPGPECISVFLGVLDAPGVCTTAPPLISIHAVSGVGTTGGFPVSLLDTPVPAGATLDFLDLHNMFPLTPVGFVLGFGSLFGSERVWSFNMP